MRLDHITVRICTPLLCSAIWYVFLIIKKCSFNLDDVIGTKNGPLKNSISQHFNAKMYAVYQSVDTQYFKSSYRGIYDSIKYKWSLFAFTFYFLIFWFPFTLRLLCGISMKQQSLKRGCIDPSSNRRTATCLTFPTSVSH